MHAFGTLATLALLLGAANAKCYGGNSWSLDRNLLKGQIASACNDGRLSGVFSTGESKKVCVNISSNLGSLGKLDMEIKVPDNSNGRISNEDCTHQLNKLVDNCLVALGPLSYGGEDIVSAWFFKADANNGNC